MYQCRSQTAGSYVEVAPRIGGWLALLGLGLILSVVADISVFVQAHDSTYVSVSLFEALFDGYVLYLFACKRRTFPGWCIAWFIYNTLATVNLMNSSGMYAEAAYLEAYEAGSLIAAVSWITYLVRSKRVGATFVN